MRHSSAARRQLPARSIRGPSTFSTAMRARRSAIARRARIVPAPAATASRDDGAAFPAAPGGTVPGVARAAGFGGWKADIVGIAGSSLSSRRMPRQPGLDGRRRRQRLGDRRARPRDRFGHRLVPRDAIEPQHRRQPAHAGDRVEHAGRAVRDEAVLREVPVGFLVLRDLFVGDGDQDRREQRKAAGDAFPPDAERALQRRARNCARVSRRAYASEIENCR